MKKTFQELQDETLIADLGEGGNICDISIDKLRSPTMKKLHKASCPRKEKDTAMRSAGKRAGLTRSARDKLYNSVEVEEGYQEIQNLADLIQSETGRLVKAAKKGDMKTVLSIYKAIGKIIK
jgi:hypothetical protein